MLPDVELMTLKSNMDRFIGFRSRSYMRFCRALKSNMDRFIVNTKRIIKPYAPNFKIQYG